MRATPSQFGVERRSPRKTAPKTATRTTLILSIGALQTRQTEQPSAAKTEVQISLTVLTLSGVHAWRKGIAPLRRLYYVSLEMGMGSPDNRREADDSCQALCVGRSLLKTPPQ